MSETVQAIVNSLIPSNLITEEIDGLYGTTILSEMKEIIDNYNIYEKGTDFEVSQNTGINPATLKFVQAKQIIDKEARFLFSKRPDIVLSSNEDGQNEEDITICQDLLNEVMKRNHFERKLVQAAKDCFIGKRVAYVVNFNEKGITVQFIPSLAFIYDTDPEDVDRIVKLVVFYITKDSKNKRDQEIYRKRYWLDNKGMCRFEEALFDGLGALKQEITAETTLQFDYIPGGVILNDGLTGDVLGTSEIDLLKDSEGWYSKLSSGDIDAMRQGMNPIKYAVDMDANTTKNLSTSAGAFWDLTSNVDSPVEGVSGKVGVLESSMKYSASLDKTLNRIRSAMLDSVDMPDIKELSMKVTSGKALKAIYWGLVVRCDEKMLSWRHAIEHIALTVIDGAIKYPVSTTKYNIGKLTVDPMMLKVTVDNQYPLPEDEAEEKTTDLAEVTANTMSRKSYMKKWRGLTDADADLELQQIARENDMLEMGALNVFNGQVNKKPGQQQDENPPPEGVPGEEEPELNPDEGEMSDEDGEQ